MRLWHQGWHDAHSDLVPAAVLSYRTPAFFQVWLDQSSETTFVARRGDGVVGFYAIEQSELCKLYVAAPARGSGVAGRLLSDAERQLMRAGIAEAMLLCTAGNTRAQRFYERSGWHLAETIMDRLWSPNGELDALEVPTHRYLKTLRAE